MDPMFIALIVVAAVMLLLAALYNSLVGKKNQVDNAFGGIDAMLMKRYDEYFEDFQVAVGIVEDLQLNLRIWSKD